MTSNANFNRSRRTFSSSCSAKLLRGMACPYSPTQPTHNSHERRCTTGCWSPDCCAAQNLSSTSRALAVLLVRSFQLFRQENAHFQLFVSLLKDIRRGIQENHLRQPRDIALLHPVRIDASGKVVVCRRFRNLRKNCDFRCMQSFANPSIRLN